MCVRVCMCVNEREIILEGVRNAEEEVDKDLLAALICMDVC